MAVGQGLGVVMAWTADRLAVDLVKLLELRRWIAVHEVALYDRLDRRADVLAMLRSGQNTRLMVFELKISRSDLLADLRAEKWRAYLPAAPVTFALPAGLADPREIPADAGLLIRSDAGWRWKRQAATWKTAGPPLETMRRLVMAVADQTARRVHQAQPRKASLWSTSFNARTEVARRIAGVAARLDQSETDLRSRRAELAELDMAVRERQAELSALAGQIRALSRAAA